MKTKFFVPNFNNGCVEIRADNDGISLYFTDHGIDRFINILMILKQNGGDNHIHLEDFEILTKNSIPCALAVFKQTNN